jgi:hypothetical protein
MLAPAVATLDGDEVVELPLMPDMVDIEAPPEPGATVGVAVIMLMLILDELLLIEPPTMEKEAQVNRVVLLVSGAKVLASDGHHGRIRGFRTDDNALVAEEVHGGWIRGQIRLGVAGGEGHASDVTVLASQITSLARLRLAHVAGEVLATVSGIQVAHGRGAVAVSRDGKGVNVVDCLLVNSGLNKSNIHSANHSPKGP